MKLNCIIIDDEPLARKGLENYIKEIDYLNLINSFSNPILAIETLDTQKIDIIFLDIQMPKITGLEFIRTINHPAKIIITTAYANFAIDSFELDVTDYLLKPISFERFLKAVGKAKKHLQIENHSTTESEKYFFVKSESKLEKIILNDILFIQAMENYVIIQTVLKKYVCYLTLKAVEDFLPSDTFIKVQKSYIIAINKISSIEGNSINVGNHQIAISRHLKDDVLDQIIANKFLKR